LKEDIGVKIQKTAIWIVLIGILILLSKLFAIIFLTFILTYIGNTLLKLMAYRLKYRRLNLVIIYVLFLLAIVGFSGAVIPRVFSETRNLAKDFLAEQVRREAELEAITESQNHRHLKMEPSIAVETDTAEQSIVRRETRHYLDKTLQPLLDPESFASFKNSDLYNELLIKIDNAVEDFVPVIVNAVKSFINHLAVIGFHFALALILSFIILWDLPNLILAAQSFSEGKTEKIYAEIAPSLKAFGTVLGRAFEAQSGIAIVNAVLTAIGFWIIGLKSIALLSTIVFFCSYIPVLGVILSSLPAAILAFKAGGIIKIFLLVIVILIVHTVETYALNPLIYGHHMNLHPIVVLVILLIGEHLFGVWGLLLGVPVSAFILKYVIRGEKIE